MLPRMSNVGWVAEEEEEEGGEDGSGTVPDVSWSRTNGTCDFRYEMGLTSFKSMLEDDWYLPTQLHTQQQQDVKSVISFPSDPSPPNGESLILQQQCSSSSVFNLDPSHSFFSQKNNTLTSLLNTVCSSSNPFDSPGFDLGYDASGFLSGPPISDSSVLLNRSCDDGGNDGGILGFHEMGSSDLARPLEFISTGFDQHHHHHQSMVFGALNNPPLSNANHRSSKLLQPLDMFSSGVSQPTFSQKRVASLRRSSMLDEGGNIDGGSFLNYDSDEVVTEIVKAEENGDNDDGRQKESNAQSTTTEERKGKRKGLPAKNLMAERRRRKKLNDRLYMLRSVVPKISKV